MLFGTFIWIIILLIPLRISPEFVVQEIQACCHHRITLSCGGSEGMRIVVVQARYVIDEEQQIAAAVPSSQPIHPFPTQKTSQDEPNHAADNLPSKNIKAISLWDLDIKFVHDIINENLPHPVHVNAPHWHPSHISTYEGKQPFLSFQHSKFTTPPVFPSEDGFNFTGSRVMEMPPYQMNFLDKDTIWKEPLFQIGSSVNNIHPSSSFYTPSVSSFNIERKTGKIPVSYGVNEHLASKSRESRSDSYFINQGLAVGECWSYQALSSTSATFTTDPNRIKPPWHFKDLRTYFNQRCSGRNKCTVDLLRGKQPDPDVTKLCHLLPEGKITVKYLCYDSNSEIVHSKCNVDVTPANEGFLHNPGYPDLYPGDHPCQWRLHVPQQKILLVFFDISLRGQEKSICRDELVASEEHSKLLSTCGDHSSAVAVLSESHQLNVTLIPKSRLAYPKRGFLIYYRVLGCRDPALPANSYIVFRNATHAYILCDLGHLYSDTLKRDRWLYCNPLEHTWEGETALHCQDIRGNEESVTGNLSIAQILIKNPSLWPVRRKISKDDDIVSDVLIPICVMIALFAVNGIVLCFIYKQRRRLEEMENERNQEMEEICAAVIESSNSPVDDSSYSFPSSGVDEFAWHDPFDDDLLDETDQDRTLTTLTLHTSSPPDSAAAMKHYYDSSRNTESRNGGNSYYRFSHDGSSSFSNSGLISTTLYTSFHHSALPRQNDIPPTLNLVNGNRGHLPTTQPGSHVSGFCTEEQMGNKNFLGHHYFGFSTRTTDV